MQLTQAQIRKFQMLYREKFSVELSDDEAKEKGMQLLGIMRRVYKPIAPALAKEALLYGGGNAATVGARTYGQTGDIKKAAKEALRTGLTTAAMQTALLGGGYMLNKGGKAANNAAKEMRRPTPLTDDEIYSARKMFDYQTGVGQNPSVQDALNFRRAEAKLGQRPGTPDGRHAVSNALDQHTAWRSRQRAKEAGFIKVPGVPEKPVDPLSSLKQEALKYKSAEEFVNSRAGWYHGSNTPIDQLDFSRKAPKGNELPYGVHFTQDKQIAGDFATGATKGSPMSGGRINAAQLNLKNPFDVSTAGIYRQGSKEFDVLSQIAEKSGKKPTYLNIDGRGQALAVAKPDTTLALDPKQVLNDAKPNIIKQVLKQNGYDQAIKYKMLGTADPLGMGAPVRTDAIAVLDKNLVSSDKQLTDLYNQAHSGAKTLTNKPTDITPARQPQPLKSETPQNPQPSAAKRVVKAKTEANAPAKSIQPLKQERIVPQKQLSTVRQTYPDNTTNEVKKRGFTESVKSSPEVSPTVKKGVSGEYNVRSTDKLALSADKYSKGNLSKVTEDVNLRLDKEAVNL